MPRTPAPLTVKASISGRWAAVDDRDRYIASFLEEADARAFVALPALQQAAMNFLRDAEEFRIDSMTLTADVSSEVNMIKARDVLRAALAQADGHE